MRSRSRQLLVGVGSFFVAASLVAPSFAAKKAISDAELDSATAAGQPTVITTSGNTASVTFTPRPKASYS